MTPRFVPLRLTPIALSLVMAAAASSASGAGFQLNETSASGLGNAFAGGAAAAEDATTLWSNVAGLSRLHKAQVVGVIHLVKPSIRFGNETSAAATSQALGGDGGDAGGLDVVPNLYAVMPLDQEWAVGVGLNSPFGLVTEYDNRWAGRFQAIKSSIRTVNVNPGVSWKVAPDRTVGFGVNFQHITAEFTNQVNYSAALLSAAIANGIAPGSAPFNAIAQATAGLESGVRIKGNDNAWGWNVGVLWEIDRNARLGAAYRSSVKYEVRGNAQFSNPGVAGPAPIAALAAGVNASALFDSEVTADVKLPAIVNLSYFETLNDRWDMLVDAQWTQWSTIQALNFVRGSGVLLQGTPENFKSTWKLAVGLNHRYNSEWTWRGGLAFDQSPVHTSDRTARLPDADRTWLAGGLAYTWMPQLKFDLGAAYVIVKKAAIDNSGSPPNAAAYGRLNGPYEGNTVIVSAQLSYTY